jgi:hypothetical protein
MTRPFSILLFALSLLACNNQKTARPDQPSSRGPLTVTFEEFRAEKCLEDSVCALLHVVYPVVSGGGDPAVLQSINDTARVAVYALIGADDSLAPQQAFDTAALELYAMLEEQYEVMPERGISFINEIDSKALLQNDRVLSYEIVAEGYTGGAHGHYYVFLATFDLQTGKMLQLPDLVRDTAALRPLLEKAFVDAKRDFDPNISLQDLLLEPESPLALPANACVEEKGLRMMYNHYEVAPYAVGPTDILLTWEQLGSLADRSRWGL